MHPTAPSAADRMRWARSPRSRHRSAHRLPQAGLGNGHSPGRLRSFGGRRRSSERARRRGSYARPATVLVHFIAAHRQHARLRCTLQKPPETNPGFTTYPVSDPEAMVQPAQLRVGVLGAQVGPFGRAAVSRPSDGNPEKMSSVTSLGPLVDKTRNGRVLASTHAPAAGGDTVGVLRRNSAVVQRCAPGNSAAQIACMPIGPLVAPVVVATL